MTETSAAGGASAAGCDADGSEQGTAGLIRVVRGEPSAEELAALVAVLISRAAGSGGEQAAPRKVSGWTDRSRYVHAPGARSPGGWRASAFPR